jgi:hypothetical protein
MSHWNDMFEKWVFSETRRLKSDLKKLQKATQFNKLEGYQKVIAFRKELVAVAEKHIKQFKAN